MNQTKNKILEQSLKLFNARGVSEVSLRTIAEELNISVGNLQYHFKKREDIIVALYFQLVEKIDKEIEVKELSENMIESFFYITQAISASFFEYRFFLLDFNLIIRQHEKIKIHYKELIQNREHQFFMAVHVMIEQELIRKEILPGEYKNLFKRIQILSDFWISSAVIESKSLSTKILDEYVQVITQTLFPYLTEEGRTQYIKTSK